MKMKKILAALACAAALCVPALAAGTIDAPGAGPYVPEPRYHMVWGSASWWEKGTMLQLTNSDADDAFRDILLRVSGDTIVVDAVTGDPLALADIREGQTVYGWIGQTVLTSMPPQASPVILLTNIPADYQVPQFDIIARCDGIMALEIPDRSGMAITLSDGTAYRVWEEARVWPYLTRNRVTYQDLVPGTQILVWAGAEEGTAEKVLVFPYRYNGSLSLDAYGRLYIDACVALEPNALRRPYGDERLYVPIRAVAEAAGFDVAWDKDRGAVVSASGETVFSILPDSTELCGPAAEKIGSLSGPCLIADGVTYLEIHDLAGLLGMFY